MNALTSILDATSASDVHVVEVLAVIAGCALGALGGHRLQARSHRVRATAVGRDTPPTARPR